MYAITAKRRSKDGRVRVMGVPPIGNMALAAVLKERGDVEGSAATGT